MLQTSIASGFPVYLRHLARDDDTLVYLDIVGQPDNVRATWAALKDNGRSHHWLLNAPLQLQKNEHLVLRQTLPCGWAQTVMIHQQASHTALDPGSRPFLYLLDWQRRTENAGTEHGRSGRCAGCSGPLHGYDCIHAHRCDHQRMPASFHPMLAKALPYPILPAWAPHLWHQGLAAHLIRPSKETSHRTTAFFVATTPTKWRDILATGLQQGTLTF